MKPITAWMTCTAQMISSPIWAKLHLTLHLLVHSGSSPILRFVVDRWKPSSVPTGKLHHRPHDGQQRLLPERRRDAKGRIEIEHAGRRDRLRLGILQQALRAVPATDSGHAHPAHRRAEAAPGERVTLIDVH